MPKPKPPSDLSPDAKKLWRQIYDVSDMDPAAVVMLDSLCEQWDRVREARKLVAKDGLVIQEKTAAGNTHHRANPAVAIERDSMALVVRCWKALGFDQQPPEAN